MTVDSLELTLDDVRALATGEGPREAVLAVPRGHLGLGALRAPEVHLTLEIATPTGTYAHVAWVAHDAVTLLLDLGDRFRLLVLPPDHLAAGLARIVGLQPRKPRPREARAAEDAELAAWFSADARERAAAWSSLGADRAWLLSALRPDEEEPGGRLLAVADGPSGTWLVAESDGALRLEPTRPTDVWRRLAGLLPGLG